MHLPSILLYMSSSMAIVMVNKIVLTSYSFPSVPFLMFWQSVVSAFFYRHSVQQKPNAYILLACACNLANVLAGLSAAGQLNVAMFGTLRKMSILMTMLAQWVVFYKRPSSWTVLSVLGIVVGTVIASYHDLTFDAKGYTYVMLNNIFTVASQITNKMALQNGAPKQTLLFYSSMVSLCITAALSASFRPEHFEHWWDWSFKAAFLSSLALGIILNWSVAWLLEENDALTLSVSGSIKSTLTGLIVCMGWFDPTYIFSWENFWGLQLSALASLLYVFAKH